MESISKELNKQSVWVTRGYVVSGLGVYGSEPCKLQSKNLLLQTVKMPLKNVKLESNGIALEEGEIKSRIIETILLSFAEDSCPKEKNWGHIRSGRSGRMV